MIKILFQSAVLLIAAIFSCSVNADTISVVADERAPYNGDPYSAEPGYGIEIVKRIFEAAEHKVDYKIVPWTRAIKTTQEGKYNAVIGATREEVPDFVFPLEEFGVSGNSFFVKKANPWRFNGEQSLLQIKIGVIADYFYGNRLDKFLGENKRIVQYAYGEDPLLKNIKKLLSGRFDVLVEDPNVFAQKAKQMGVAGQIIPAVNIGSGDVLYIAFSPEIARSEEYADLLTKGIIRLKKTGELDEILVKYGVEYWK